MEASTGLAKLKADVLEAAQGVAAATAGNQIADAVNKYHATLDQAVRFLLERDSADVTDALAELRRGISAGVHGEVFRRLDEMLKEFRGTVSQFNRDHGRATALRLVTQGSDIIVALRVLQETLEEVKHRITATMASPPEGYGYLALSIAVAVPFPEAIEREKALEDLYNLMCEVYGESPTQYPFEVARFEFGSVEVLALGKLAVMLGLGKLLTALAIQMYQNHTVAGKKEALLTDAQTARAFHRIFAEVEQEGGTVPPEARHNLQKVLVSVTRRAVKLYEGAEFVNINGEIEEIAPTSVPLRLPPAERKLLTDGASRENGGGEEGSPTDKAGTEG